MKFEMIMQLYEAVAELCLVRQSIVAIKDKSMPNLISSLREEEVELCHICSQLRAEIVDLARKQGLSQKQRWNLMGSIFV